MISAQTNYYLHEQMMRLPAPLVELLQGDRIRNLADGLQSATGLSDEQTAELENEITLTVLGYKSIQLLHKKIDDIIKNQDTVELLLSALETIFTDEIIEILVEIDQSVNQKDLSNDIAETEEALKTISGLRTMESDMLQVSNEPVITAAPQDEILSRPSQTESDPTNYPIEAKWESENETK